MPDRLTLTRAFEGAGIDSAVAERIATEIYDAITANVATKADIAALRGDLDHAVAGLRGEIREMEQHIVIRLGSLVVIVAGLLVAALHYWGPASPSPAPAAPLPQPHASLAANP